MADVWLVRLQHMRTAAWNFLCAVGQVTACWNLFGCCAYIHRRVQGFCLWVQQCSSAKGTRTRSSRALAEGRPRAKGKDTRYTSLSLNYNFSSKVKVFFEALQEAWLDVLFCLFWQFCINILHFFSNVHTAKTKCVCSRPNWTDYASIRQIPQ